MLFSFAGGVAVADKSLRKTLLLPGPVLVVALLKHAQRPVSKRRQQLTLHPANFQELINDGELQDIAEASTEVFQKLLFL